MSSRNLIKNVTSLGLVQIVNYIFPLITVPYISRIIGPEGYGLINYGTAFIAYFTLLIGYGFDLTATRKISKNSNDKEYVNRIVAEVLSSRIVLFLVSIVVFGISLLLITPLNKEPLVAFFLFIGCIGTALSPQYIYQGFQELSIFSKANFVKGVLNTILVFILIKSSSDYFILPLLSSFFLVAINLFLLWYAARKFDLTISFLSFKEAISVIYNDRIIFFSTIVISLYTTTNIVVLGFFADSTDVGYFTTSQIFLGIIGSIVSAPLSLSIYPFVGVAFGKSEGDGLELLKRILPIILYITFAASLFVFLFAPYIITVIYGSKFDNSILPLRILAFVPFIVSMSNVFGVQFMLNMGLDRLFFKITSGACLFGITLNLFMAKYYGYIGTAVSSLIIESLVTLSMFVVLLKRNVNLFEFEYFNPKFLFRFITSLKK